MSEFAIEIECHLNKREVLTAENREQVLGDVYHGRRNPDDQDRWIEVGDEFHQHFIGFSRWDWVEVADEARRLWGSIVEDEVEKHSFFDNFLAAVAGQANDGAYRAIAAALGVDPNLLLQLGQIYEEAQDDPPPSVGIAGLEVALAEIEKETSGGLHS